MSKKSTTITKIEQSFIKFKDEALINPEKRVISTRGKEHSITLTESQLKEFKRVWTDDESEPFYKVRKNFPIGWYVADGVLIKVCANGLVYWIRGDRHGAKNNRLKIAVYIEDTTTKMYLSTIHLLTNGTLDMFDSTRKQLEEQGIAPILLQEVQTHHVNGFVPFEGQSVAEYEEQNKEVQMLPRDFHDAMHKAITYKRTIDLNTGALSPKDKKKLEEQQAKMVNAMPLEEGELMSMVGERINTKDFIKEPTKYVVSKDAQRAVEAIRNADEKLDKKETEETEEVLHGYGTSKIVHKTETITLSCNRNPSAKEEKSTN